MDENKSTMPKGQSGTAQGIHVFEQGIYINFEIEGLEQVKALIQEQKKLITKLEDNVHSIARVMVLMNARISQNPKTGGSADCIG